jgi:hypothetical protein
VNSGENFEPENTVPVPAGGFVRRVARTPHYDGVKKAAGSPRSSGIFGQAPIEFKRICSWCRPASAARSTRKPKRLALWLKTRPENRSVHRVREAVAHVRSTFILDVHVEFSNV